MTYSRTTRLDTEGQASAAAITAFLQSRAPGGLTWVRANEQGRIRQYLHIEPSDLQLLPVPTDVGNIIVAACSRWAHLTVGGRQVIINHDLVTGGLGHESAWLQSVIYRLKRNPAGYGASNDNPVGNAVTFASLADAIDMYVRHLCGYVYGDGPWRSTRFHLLGSNAGSVTEVWHLEQKYAFSENYASIPVEKRYGSNVAAAATALLVFAATYREDSPMATSYEHVISGLQDIRHLLKRNPAGGSEGRMALSQKYGAVIHFNGPDVSATDDRRFIIDVIAPYHASKDFSRAGDGSAIGDGLMYHVGIGRHGEKFLMRDLEAGLWHSGSSWNDHSLALFFPIGINQRATPAALTAAREVLDDWRRFTKGSREQVKGHQELSSTNCPGTLMADLVRPYRAGSDAPVIVEPGPAPGVPGAQPDPWRFDEAAKNYAAAWNKGQPFWVLDPFVDWLLQRGGLATMGYVTSGAFIAQDTGILTQFFEGGALEWWPNNPPAHRVLRRHTGLEVLHVRYPERVPA